MGFTEGVVLQPESIIIRFEVEKRSECLCSLLALLVFVFFALKFLMALILQP